MLHETIYSDDNVDESETLSESFPPDKSAKWGEYQMKPVAQSAFENIVKTSIAEITSETPKMGRNYDLRPYIKDKASNSWLLVDSGAACTIWPASKCDKPALDNRVKLQAVNNSQIDTFGKKRLKLNLGKATYVHSAIVADVKTGILGFDFLTAHKLDLVWAGSQCFLHPCCNF